MLERYEAALGKEGDLLGGSFWKGISFVRGGGAAVIWMSLMHNRGGVGWGLQCWVLENSNKAKKPIKIFKQVECQDCAKFVKCKTIFILSFSNSSRFLPNH